MPTRASGRRGRNRRRRMVAAVALSADSPDRIPTVVYIHGIGNKPAPSVLKRQWDLALFQMDMGARTRMAYWADIRYPQPLPSGQVEGLGIPSPEAYHSVAEQDIRSEAPALAPYGEEAEAYAAALAARLRVGRMIRGIQPKILPGFIRRPATEWLTKTFIRDSAAYFFDAEQRDAMRERLRRLLIPENQPYVVVAHSQGSIIAYDVLRALAQKIEILLFLTIGSPLGLEEVQDHLTKPLRVPSQVPLWKNFADRLDPVALDADLEDDFTPRGAIIDHQVWNRDTVRLVNFNPHSGTGYLSVMDVRTAVNEVVGRNFREHVTPFIIARDVAAEMADPLSIDEDRLAEMVGTSEERMRDGRGRVPVLIEISEAVQGTDLKEKRTALIRRIRDLVPERINPQVDPLRRYVAARLSPLEIDRLAAQYRDLKISHIWKNSQKRALLNVSTHVVQAYTAQLGYRATGKDITWAILDTGIAATHPHFGNPQDRDRHNIAAQFDCTVIGTPYENLRGPASDRDGHGTHVAGIIAGQGTDEKGTDLKGIAPDAKLYIYKVLRDDGTGDDAFIIKALDHIASLNEASPIPIIHGVNLSLGGPFDATVFGCGYSPLCNELRRLWRQGVVVCVAAGNEGHATIETVDGAQELNLDLSIGDPANLEEAIAVGSVHKEFPHLYGPSYFSSRGPTADGRVKPDVVAPGEQIISCNARFDGRGGRRYISMSGTSMACPHVSGVVAAFLSVRREFIGHPDRVKEILMKSCTDLKRDRYHQGAGMPNLIKMLAQT